MDIVVLEENSMVVSSYIFHRDWSCVIIVPGHSMCYRLRTPARMFLAVIPGVPAAVNINRGTSRVRVDIGVPPDGRQKTISTYSL